MLMLAVSTAACAKPQKTTELAAPSPAPEEVPEEAEKPIEELHVLADSVYYETLEDLVMGSSAIIIGEAGEVSSRRIKDDRVRTYTEVRIKESIKGDVPEDQCITVKQLGGEADGLRMIVEERNRRIPYLQTGKEYLLFLKPASSAAESDDYFLANSFAVFEIEDGKVVPVSLASDFIAKPTELEIVKEQVQTCLNQSEEN